MYAIAAHKICVWQKVDRLGLFQGFAWGQREWVELGNYSIHQLRFNLLLNFVVYIGINNSIFQLCRTLREM